MEHKRADKRKFHYIYKITRFDGKYYIGLHSTDNLDDGYFGSGKQLWNSINYHGREKHTKEILEFLPDRDSLKKREKELVNEECLNDPLCMNLRLGGEGGWDHVNNNKDEEYYRIRKKIGLINGPRNVIHILNYYHSPEDKRSYSIKGGKAVGPTSFKNKRHTAETKRKIGKTCSEKQSGNRNSQYGTIWITNGLINKKIKRDDIIPENFRVGRKIKH